ncbi:galactose-binding like [Fusarium longipes]|uniref:Galactose-binding like n=1 Tax=Fusarium longipes TaxID=694270 RepID=A0A395T894_9HYPO|nr:galactose-binding like [Fusarium longipes]
MRFQPILLAALFGAASAVPCYPIKLNIDGGRNTGWAGFDPFGEQPEGYSWDIVPASDCWVRWQAIRPGQTPNDARVFKTKFDSTPDSVRYTIMNYFNHDGKNDMLWLPMRTRSLQYSHMLPASMEDHETIDPQSSLSDSSRVVVSIILPSGKEKLQQVRATRTGDTQDDSNIYRAEEVGITGLTGTISTGDWAYITGTELRLAMRQILKEQRDAFYERRPWKKEEFAYALAEKANGDCVVIDFRDFDEFVIRLRPASMR